MDVDCVHCAAACRVVLEPLAEAQEAVIKGQNATALQTFVQYVHCFVRSMPGSLEDPSLLPLSGLHLLPACLIAALSLY